MAEDRKPEAPPHAWMPTAALTDRRLNATDLRVLGMIAAHANRATGLAWPSLGRIAALLEIDRSHVRRSRKRLEAAGYLIVERRANADGTHRSNRYRIGDGGGAVSRPWVGPPDAPTHGASTRPPEQPSYEHHESNISSLTEGNAGAFAAPDHAFNGQEHAEVRQIGEILLNAKTQPDEALQNAWDRLMEVMLSTGSTAVRAHAAGLADGCQLELIERGAA